MEKEVPKIKVLTITKFKKKTLKMGYKCGNCSLDFATRREMIEHMIKVHNSPFVEGDYVAESDAILKEMGKTELMDKVKLARVL
jgi:hypothetical protein